MGLISVTMWTTLDGVVQGLGRPDEDTRGGFEHGGWGPQFQDDVLSSEMARGMAEPGDMLLGRRTWEDFARVWGSRTDNPYSATMNATTKYVASRERLDLEAWPNSVLLQGDAAETVGRLKAESDRNLGIIGSASLVRSLHAAGLIDRYTLIICPLTLGSGARLFESPGPLTQLELLRSVPTTKGVIVAEYVRR